MKTVHVSQIISEGGRSGKVESSTGHFRAQFTAGDTDDSITPELLFAGAYAACFHGAVLAAVERAHKKVTGSQVVASVRLMENQQGGYELAVELRAALPGLSRTEGEHILHQAHETCPYSKATRGNISVVLVLD